MWRRSGPTLTKKTYQDDIDLQKHLAELDAFCRENIRREKNMSVRVLSQGELVMKRLFLTSRENISK